MGIYNISTDGISEVQKTTFEAGNILERQHLQNYLRDQIEIISPDTLVISEEFCEWDESKRRIDLLGIDKDANLVVIELKRNDTGNHMELQALRYASMISTMSFEKCISIFQDYLDKRRFNNDAKETLLSFLSWDNPLENEFAPDVKIVLASADFSKELTTSVMWLITKGVDIRCIKLEPYKFNSDYLLDINQIIPLPEAESYLIKIKEKAKERETALQSSKDKTKYFFNSLLLGKGRFVFQVVKYYLELHPESTYEQLINKFPQSLQGSTGVINRLELVKSKYAHHSIKRHFMGNDDILKSADAVEFVICNQWGIDNINNIVNIAELENYVVEERQN